MASQDLIDAVGRYIDRYYEPVSDDIKIDKEMKSVFSRITNLRKKRAEARSSADTQKSTKESRCADTQSSAEVQMPQIEKAKEPEFQAENINELEFLVLRENCEIYEAAEKEFDCSTMEKTKIYKGMSSAMSLNRNIEDLMCQLEETFSERLLRMIDERGMTDSEAYTKAYVDRRHFSKIRKDVNYVPNKKTVLAFTIALELSLDEAKDLLASAGFALSRSSKTDVIIAYFLQNRIYDMFEINDILDAYGQPVF